MAKSKGKLKGAVIKFPKISVGASENSIIASVLARENFFKELCNRT